MWVFSVRSIIKMDLKLNISGFQHFIEVINNSNLWANIGFASIELNEKIVETVSARNIRLRVLYFPSRMNNSLNNEK